MSWRCASPAALRRPIDTVDYCIAQRAVRRDDVAAHDYRAILPNINKATKNAGIFGIRRLFRHRRAASGQIIPPFSARILTYSYAVVNELLDMVSDGRDGTQIA